MVFDRALSRCLSSLALTSAVIDALRRAGTPDDLTGLMEAITRALTFRHYAPRDNILAGTFFLRLMYDRFGYPGLFGAYNAGPSAYADYLAGRRRLPGETVAYFGTVGGAVPAGQPMPAAVSSPPLFIVRRAVSVDEPPSSATEGQSLLFAVRKVAP